MRSHAHPTVHRHHIEESLANAGLDALELKARAQHICTALEATLPGDFPLAAKLMEQALATMDTLVDETMDGPTGARGDGLAGWSVWPLTEYVAMVNSSQKSFLQNSSPSSRTRVESS